jgi:FixJ family two-component response regulator
VPIIFITSHDDTKTQERIAKSGAIGLLQKPCDQQAVLAAIHRAVRGGSEDPFCGRDGAARISKRPEPNDGTSP